MMMQSLKDREWKSAAELKAHYAAVRKRIYQPDNVYVSPKEIAKKKEIVEIKPRSREAICTMQVETFVSIASMFYHMPMSDIMRGGHKAQIRVRHIVFYLARTIARKSLKHIGGVMGYQINTIYEGVHKVALKRATDL